MTTSFFGKRQWCSCLGPFHIQDKGPWPCKLRGRSTLIQRLYHMFNEHGLPWICVRPTSERYNRLEANPGSPQNIFHSLTCRNPCKVFIRCDFVVFTKSETILTCKCTRVRQLWTWIWFKNLYVSLRRKEQVCLMQETMNLKINPLKTMTMSKLVMSSVLDRVGCWKYVSDLETNLEYTYSSMLHVSSKAFWTLQTK